MPRLSRRLTTTLLWLALALLPLRGMAAALMSPAAMDMQPAVSMAASIADAAAMPCHGASQDPADGAADGLSHACSLCALCHGSLAEGGPAAPALPALPEAAPLAGAPTAIEPRAPDGLFRPPRTLGA